MAIDAVLEHVSARYMGVISTYTCHAHAKTPDTPGLPMASIS